MARKPGTPPPCSPCAAGGGSALDDYVPADVPGASAEHDYGAQLHSELNPRDRRSVQPSFRGTQLIAEESRPTPPKLLHDVGESGIPHELFHLVWLWPWVCL